MLRRVTKYLIGAVLFFSVPMAQAAYVGIPSSAIFFAAEQENSNWCWAASIQMVLKSYDISITQSQIVARTYGLDPNGPLPNWTGSFSDITNNLNNWNVDNSGKHYSVSASLNWGAPTPAILIRELRKGRPVLVGYQSGQNSGHAVVITAINYEMSPKGPVIQSIFARDPWPSPQNIANSGRVEYPGIQIASLMQAYWYVRVKKINTSKSHDVSEMPLKAAQQELITNAKDNDDKVAHEAKLKRQGEIVTAVNSQNLLGVGKARNPTVNFVNNCQLEMEWRWTDSNSFVPNEKKDKTEHLLAYFDEDIEFKPSEILDEDHILLNMQKLSYDSKTKWITYHNSTGASDAGHRNAQDLPGYYRPNVSWNGAIKFERNYVINLLNELVKTCH